MKKMIPFIFILFISSLLLYSPKYKYESLGSVERANDLIDRITIEEKVGQLLYPMGKEMYEMNGTDVSPSPKSKKLVKNNISVVCGQFIMPIHG